MAQFTGHSWRYIGAGKYQCDNAGCGAENAANETCLSPVSLQKRFAELADDAEQLIADMRGARDAAPSGEKAKFRYPLRDLEHAAALIRKAGL